MRSVLLNDWAVQAVDTKVEDILWLTPECWQYVTFLQYLPAEEGCV